MAAITFALPTSVAGRADVRSALMNPRSLPRRVRLKTRQQAHGDRSEICPTGHIREMTKDACAKARLASGLPAEQRFERAATDPG